MTNNTIFELSYASHVLKNCSKLIKCKQKDWKVSIILKFKGWLSKYIYIYNELNCQIQKKLIYYINQNQCFLLRNESNVHVTSQGRLMGKDFNDEVS